MELPTLNYAASTLTNFHTKNLPWIPRMKHTHPNIEHLQSAHRSFGGGQTFCLKASSKHSKVDWIFFDTTVLSLFNSAPCTWISDLSFESLQLVSFLKKDIWGAAKFKLSSATPFMTLYVEDFAASKGAAAFVLVAEHTRQIVILHRTFLVHMSSIDSYLL